MDATQPNTPPQIHRVRRRGGFWHVSFAARPPLVVPVANAGRYESKVAFGFSPDGALTAREVR